MSLRNKVVGFLAASTMMVSLDSDIPTYKYPTYPFGNTLAADSEKRSIAESTIKKTAYASYLITLDAELKSAAKYKELEPDFYENLDPLFALMFKNSNFYEPTSLYLFARYEGAIAMALSKATRGYSFVVPWENLLVIERNQATIWKLTHEFGHVTDPKLSILSYVLDDRDALRAEIVADSFQCSLGEILAEEHHSGIGLELFDDCIAYDETLFDGKSFYDIAEMTHFSSIPGLITLMYGSGPFESFKDIYAYALEHDAESLFKNIEAVLGMNPSRVMERSIKVLEAKEKEYCRNIDSEFCRFILKAKRR